MITPNDIETKVFSSSLRGYNKREVDEFLDQIMIDYQALLDQNAKMLERVHVLQKQVAEAKDPARMTQDAKRLMNDISASAEQKAEVIIKNAKHDAENIVRNAKNSTTQADEDAERLRRKVEKFKLRFKQMLEDEIEKLDDNSEDLLDDLREDFYPSMLYSDRAGDMTRVAGGSQELEDPIADLPDVEPSDDVEEETLPEDDQNPDAEEAAEPVSEITDTVQIEVPEEAEEAPEEAETTEEEAEEPEEEAAETEGLEEAEEPEETSAEAEGPEEAEETEADAAEEPEEPEADQDEAEDVEQEEADEENLKRSEESGDDRHAPAETIVIDKMALAEAFRKQEQEASLTEDDLGKFSEYDDPDKAEPEEEPETLSEEEQAAKYADYAGGADGAAGVPLIERLKVFQKKDK